MAMKILYGVTKSNFGGAQKYVCELAEYAKSCGHEVYVTCGGDGLLIDKLREINIPVFPLESAQRDIALQKEIKTLWTLYNLVQKLKPDVVHLNSPKLGGLGAVVARLAGIKQIIYTNHGWPFKEHRPLWQIILIRFFSFLTILCNTKIIVLSQKELEMVQHWPVISYTAKKKIVVVPNGVTGFTTVEKTTALQSLLGIEGAKEIQKKSPIIFGNIAELHQNKGYIYALQGIHTYLTTLRKPEDPLIHFIVVSRGEEEEKLKAIVRNLDISEYVTFTGYIQDARKYLCAFDVFMMTSIKEGLPFALLEAGFAGIPVITTDVGGIPEVIMDQKNGILVPIKDQRAIAGAIQFAVDNQDTMHKYAKVLKKEIDTTFNFTSIAPRILKLYH